MIGCSRCHQCCRNHPDDTITVNGSVSRLYWVFFRPRPWTLQYVLGYLSADEAGPWCHPGHPCDAPAGPVWLPCPSLFFYAACSARISSSHIWERRWWQSRWLMMWLLARKWREHPAMQHFVLFYAKALFGHSWLNRCDLEGACNWLYYIEMNRAAGASCVCICFWTLCVCDQVLTLYIMYLYQ